MCCWLQVCYSWWCLSCLSILGRLHWIDQEALSRFILYCQVRLLACQQLTCWHHPCNAAHACALFAHIQPESNE